MKINSYEKNGWISFPYSCALNKWAKKVEEIVSAQIIKIPEGDKDLRCGGTWFPGVNFLNNKMNGDVDGASFPEELKSFIVEFVGHNLMKLMQQKVKINFYLIY